MVKKLDERISQLMPQLSLPKVLEIKNQWLEFLWRFVSLFRQKVWNSFDIHRGECAADRVLNSLISTRQNLEDVLEE